MTKVCERLVCVCQTAHSAQNSEHVVVNREHLHVVSGGGGRQRQLQLGGVNARHVQGAGGLVLLGLQGERVHVDVVGGGHVLVVLERLDQREVGTVALGEAVVAVQLSLAVASSPAT